MPDPLVAALLAGGPFVRDAAPFALIRLHGPDAGDFLQRLCSQDVLGLAPGELRPAAFLDAKGKVQATCLCGRGPAGYLLETQAHQADRLLQLLDRYHFTEQLEFAAMPGVARERVGAASSVGQQVLTVAGDLVTVACARRGVQFERWHGPSAAILPPVAGAPLAEDHAECLRMAAGLVKVGVDTEATTLALEADLDDHCSTTKGCYTGQEIVARIHTYGHVNRALAVLRLGPGAAIPAPMRLLEPAEGIAVGRVMRAVPWPAGSCRIGLGYLPRDFLAVGTQLRLEDGAPATVVG